MVCFLVVRDTSSHKLTKFTIVELRISANPN